MSLRSRITAPVSIVIITKDRVRSLEICLSSMVTQHIKPAEIVVIDNGSTDATQQVVKEFSALLLIKYVVEANIGYPFARNRGLSEARYRHVVFLDDDCIASPHWVCEWSKYIGTATAVLGRVETVNGENPFSVATRIIETYWKSNRIQNNRITDLEILDTKNLMIDRDFIQLHRIRFDESRSGLYSGASEDCDFGMQLAQKKATAIFAPRATVYHRDPDQLHSFIVKVFRSIRAHVSYEKKWQSSFSPMQFKHTGRFWKFFTQYIDKHEYSFFFCIEVFFVVSMGILINKFTRQLYS